jgi:hypothetical protein
MKPLLFSPRGGVLLRDIQPHVLFGHAQGRAADTEWGHGSAAGDRRVQGR